MKQSIVFIMVILMLSVPNILSAEQKAARTNIDMSHSIVRILKTEPEFDTPPYPPHGLRPYPVADVLIYAADKANYLAQRLRAYPDIGRVEILDARFTPLTLELALNFDAIITWPNWPYLDAMQTGDTLAAFAAAEPGNLVILASFCWFLDGNPLLGRIMTLEYSPFYSNGGSVHYQLACLGEFEETQCMAESLQPGMEMCEYYRDYLGCVESMPGVEVIAGYDDDEYFMAVKDNRVVGINAYPGDFPSPETIGDFVGLFHEAVRCYAVPAP